ncbi:Protein MLO [Vitis vinifera]|uniref:Protein MLO n=1 Tax=Vitis vinifera TaxID=29760 RepID=A0A438KIU0_VITVI|nr:Protein MLO [Vitis vinifera]
MQARFAPNSKFDFHKYIKRSMEDDFKAVVGLSMPLWASAIIFQLLNEFQIAKIMILYFLGWMTLQLVGAKLEVMIMEMAKEIRE